jgi:hypothetical protein
MANDDLDLLIGDYVLERAGQPVRELSVNLAQAAKKKPDYEAELQKLSRRVGVPIETARQLPDETRHQAALKEIDAEFLSTHFPATSNFIRPAENSDIAVDDLDNLKKHEALFGLMGEDWIGKYKAATENERFGLLTQARASVSRATPEKLKELAAKSKDTGGETLAGRAIGAFGAGVAGIGGNIVYPALQLGAELQSEIIGKPLVATGLLKRDPFASMVEEATRWRKTFDDYIKSIGGPRKTDDLVTSSVLSGFQSAGANIPTMAASIFAAPYLGIQSAANYSLNLMGLGTAGQAFGQARDQGVGTFESIPFAISQGIVEKYTERLPATKLLEGLGLNQGWKGAFRLFGSQLFHENWTEQVATHLQDLNEWAILPENKDKTVADYLAERPSAALQTLIATSVGTVLQTGAAKGIDTALNRAERQKNRLFFESLGQSATDSKLRQRMPERYREFIEAAAKGRPLEVISVPADQFREYFQSQDLSPDVVASELGANNYQEAILSGGDVAIPLGSFAEKIAPTPHLDGLMQDLRVGNGQTEREAATAAEEVFAKRAAMVDRMAELVKEQEALAPIDRAIQDITGEVEGQLVAAGTDPSTARDQATLMRGVAVLANRAFPDLDPMDAARQVWQHYGLVIERPAAGFEERQKLLDSFTGDPDFRENFDELLDLVRGGQFADTTAPSIAEMAQSLRALANKSGRTARKAGVIGVRSDQAAFDKALQAEAEAALAKAGTENEEIPFDVPTGADQASIVEQAGKLAAYLKAAGVDIEGKSNDEVFELVRKEAGTALFQSVPARGGAYFYPDSMNQEAADRFVSTGRDLSYASDLELMAIAKTDSSFHTAIRAEVANRETIRGGRDVSLDRIDFEAGGFKRGAPARDYVLGTRGRGNEVKRNGEVVSKAEEKTFFQSVPARGGGQVSAADETQAPKPEGGIDFKLYSPKSSEDSFWNSDYPRGFRVFSDKGSRWAHYDKTGKRKETGSGGSEPSAQELEKWDAAVNRAVASPLNALPDKIFIRYGNLPRRGRSTDYASGKREKGVSVYDATRDLLTDSVWPNLLGGALPAAAIVRGAESAPVYLVSGRKVGIGTDGEPLIKEVKVIGKLLLHSDENIAGYVLDSDPVSLPNPSSPPSGGGRTLFQEDDETDKLGYTKILLDGTIKIGLLEKANLSTFLHEAGHFYLEVMGDLAAIPAASQQVKDDYAAILKFLKVDSREQIKTEHHEKFAQANERYLMRGDSPSPELRGVFQRFRAWLKFIYERIRKGGLATEINEEVREIFDRIYATDAEIMRVVQELGSVQMIATPELVGWTPEQFDLYAKAVADEVETAKEDLQQKLLAEYTRAQSKAWKEEVKKTRERVTEASNLMPVYLAFNDLTRGTMLAGEPVKLRTHSLALHYGPDFVRTLPKSIHAADGNLDADTAASFFGFNDGEEMVKALASMVPQTKYITGRVKEIMAQRHGDMLVDGTIGKRAMEALHNEQRLKVLRMELRALRGKLEEVKPFIEPLQEQIKEGEKERAYENRFRDAEDATRRAQARAATEVASPALYRESAKQAIDAAAPRNIVPGNYIRASQKASRAAFAAMAKGDYIEAAIQKQRELVNHYLYLEAVKAADEVERIVKYAKKFDSGATREAMAKAQIGGGSYLGQIDAILNRYEFRKVPIVELERREGLSQWIESERKAGREPVIDPVLMDEQRKINYASVPMTELRSIHDALRNIEHLARTKNKLVYQRQQVELGQAKNELADAALNNVGQNVALYSESARPLSESAKQALQGLDAGIIKIEQLMMWLDGDNVNGPWHRYIWNPLKEAQHEQNDDTKAVVGKIDALFSKMPKAWRQSMLDKVRLNGDPIARTRKDLIGMALNLGNAQNRQKLIEGSFGGDAAVVDDLVTRLNADDWRFVQQTWDLIETLWPKIAAVQKRLTGLDPVKVEPVAFKAVDRAGNEYQLQGGYYPLVADRLKSTVGLFQESDLFEESYIHTSTSHGFTKERTKATYPLDFNFERILTHHLAQVIKDYSHREAVLAVNKLLVDNDIRGLLQTTLGEKYEPLFRGWLRDIANDTNRSLAEGMSTWSRLFTATRANVVAAVMGFKATTMISQFTGLAVSLDRVSAKHLSKSLLEYVAHPVETTQAVYLQSGELRHRADNLDRDIRQRLNMIVGKHRVRDAVQRFAFHGIAVADSMVAVITWKGAYDQALAAHKSGEEALLEADAAVRLTQGAAAIMDQSSIQRDRGEFWRATTMFYSFYNALYSTGRDIGFQVDGAKDMPRALSRWFLAFVVPAILGELILLRGPDGDDDESYLAWAARKALLSPFATVPFLRDAAQAIDSGFDLRFTPIASAIEKSARLTGRVAKDVEKDRDIDFGDYAVLVGETAGYLFGVPGTAQFSATGKYLQRVANGQEDPDNLAVLLYGAAVGKRKGN